jgi:hypothetical protein
MMIMMETLGDWKKETMSKEFERSSEIRALMVLL